MERLRNVVFMTMMLCGLLAGGWEQAGVCAQETAPQTGVPTLGEVQERAFRFFWNETDSTTGLTKDRAKNREGLTDDYRVASIAATGYMLASLPIGVEHQWTTRREAYARALTTLRFVRSNLAQHHGFYYHFLDMHTGERVWKSELSSIDTTLLVLGGLTAGAYWHGTEVEILANEIAAKVDWRWMQTHGRKSQAAAAPSMGWTPERGFLTSRWNGYSEALPLYLLGLGTPAQGLTPAAWQGWTFPTVPQEGEIVFGGPSPLFFAQMPAGFFDLRGKKDSQGRDWWERWRSAHRADQVYCARHPQNKTYAAGFWGISANDQPKGYGAEQPADGQNSGTVSPTAMLAAVLFTPAESETALTKLGTLRAKIWGRYGYANAFNIEKEWYDADVIGIDLGMMLLATENARSGLVWHLLARSPFVQRGLKATGLLP